MGSSYQAALTRVGRAHCSLRSRARLACGGPVWGASANVIAGTTAVAAGAILAMLSDTMIPEAFSDAHNMAGLVTVLGFLLAFLLTKLQQ
ncbi:MAG TPA: hypothetical protein VN085_01570 [Vicinamibacterales bacterium]|jgi:zinc transporter ZupT|nr:hypothetical protein [Vicinamibacterales bacterium]